MKSGLLILTMFLAIEAFAQPAHPDRWIREGNEQYRRQEFGRALESYNKVPGTVPESQTARFNSAIVLYKQDRKVDAVRLLTALAREADGRDLKARSYYNKGVILGQQKNLEESIEAYKSALRNNPDDREARENLQKSLLELRKKPPPPKKEEKKEPPKKNPQEKPQKQPQSRMSPKEAEQRLKLLQQKEKEVQQRIQQSRSKTGGGLPKDW